MAAGMSPFQTFKWNNYIFNFINERSCTIDYYRWSSVSLVCTPLDTVFLNTSFPKHLEVKIWVLKFHKTRQQGMVREKINQWKAAF